MNNQLRQVEQFMTSFGQPVALKPQVVISPATALLRIDLLLEEVKELATAIGIKVEARAYADRESGHVDQVKALDALTDIAYVLYGAYATLGLTPVAEEAFNEVHRSNMAKKDSLGVVRRTPGGKIIKPTSWTPPNLTAVLLGLYCQHDPMQHEFRRDVLQTDEDQQISLD